MSENTYRSDHNGECLNCDEPHEAHDHEGRCLRMPDTKSNGCTCYPWEGIHAVDCPAGTKPRTDDGKTAEMMCVALEQAPVYDDLGLSLAHTQASDTIRKLAARVRELEAALAVAIPMSASADLARLVKQVQELEREKDNALIAKVTAQDMWEVEHAKVEKLEREIAESKEAGMAIMVAVGPAIADAAIVSATFGWSTIVGGVETLVREVARLKAFRQFIERERALRDAQTKGGQHTGHSPSISPSALRRLEEFLR